MEGQIVLEKLSVLLAAKDANPELSVQDVKALLDYAKRLEVIVSECLSLSLGIKTSHV